VQKCHNELAGDATNCVSSSATHNQGEYNIGIRGNDMKGIMAQDECRKMKRAKSY